MNQQLVSHICQALATFTELITVNLPRWSNAQDPQAFLELETQVHESARFAADMVTGAILKHILSLATLQAQAVAAARAGDKPLRSGGTLPVTIRLLGGSNIRVRVPYLKPDRRKPRRGRKRKSGRRGKGGAGLYPTLAVLGIWTGATPALTDELVHHMSACDSHQSAFRVLSRRGISFNSKVIRRIFYGFAHRAREQRTKWVQQMKQQPASDSGPLAGARVVIATDGGRTRLRQPAKAGRRRKNGHRGFKAPWKEPKVLVIYIVNDQGRRLDSFRPVLDATMDDCDEIFAMLCAYLKVLGAAKAKEVIVVSDGALWIWERIGLLADALGMERERVVEVVDFYHASEAVHKVADVPRWNKTQRQQWLRKALRHLRAGHIEALKAHIESLAVGRRAKSIREHLLYFKRHKERMRYRWFKARGVPRGSGAVESAVRRVVNLRLKSNGKFWLRENAQAILLTRSYLKAGRLDDLVSWSLQTAVDSWCEPPSSPVFELPLESEQHGAEPDERMAS